MKNQMQTSLRISIAAGVVAATVILSAAERSRPGGAPVETPFVHPSQSLDWELTFEDAFSGEKIDWDKWEFSTQRRSRLERLGDRSAEPLLAAKIERSSLS